MEIIKNLFSSTSENSVNVFDRLYDYQKKAVAKTQTDDKGIICMPTGVGKTFCQAAITADDILKNPGFNMYVVNAPRIVLTYQLLKEVYGFLLHEGVEARYMFVHTGGKVNEKELEDIRINANIEGQDIPFSEIGSGTNVSGIREMIATAKKQDLPLIFFSTYNSAHKIQSAIDGFIDDEVSIVLNDEAHYLVQEQFHDILQILKSNRCYFFTATTIHTPSDKGRGMNNEELYGKVLFQMIPRDAIEMGKMVRPRLHFVTTEGVYNRNDYERSLNKIIKDTFEQHSEILTKTKPKVLVSAKGTQDIKNFITSDEYEQLIEDGVEIYAVASNDEVGNFINGERTRRVDFLERLKTAGEDPTKKLIVLHYDILAEGIDVSGFSGIMPLRTLNKSKFLQTFGRAARPDKEDRKKIDEGKLKYNHLKKMNKPYAYIMIPSVYRGNEDDKANVIQLVKELRDYGFNPVENVVSSTIINGIPEIDDPDGLNKLNSNLPQVGQIIEDTEAEIEAEVEAKLSKMDLLKMYYKK